MDKLTKEQEIVFFKNFGEYSKALGQYIYDVVDLGDNLFRFDLYNGLMLGDILENKQTILDLSYLEMAKVWGKNSKCKRKKVGALMVKNKQIISDGYNGTPSGFDNGCEEDGQTKWFVLHAESNAITKCSKSNQNSSGSTLYQTLSPCTSCSLLIIQAEIERIVFNEVYRNVDGFHYLLEAGIHLTCFLNK